MCLNDNLNIKATTGGNDVLEKFRAFHNMKCSPSTASFCIRAFDNEISLSDRKPQDNKGKTRGCILFLPSGYKDNELHFHSYRDTLSLLTYYLLVLVSFTGISSLLGFTECVDAREFDVPLIIEDDINLDSTVSTVEEKKGNNDHRKILKKNLNHQKNSFQSKDHGRESNLPKLLSSFNEPQIRVRPCIFTFIRKSHYHRISGMKIISESKNGICLKLKRRFEYNFTILGLNVIMLHIISTEGKDQNCAERLHLVEIYHFKYAIFEKISQLLMKYIEIPFLFFIHRRQKQKLN